MSVDTDDLQINYLSNNLLAYILFFWLCMVEIPIPILIVNNYS